MTGIELSKEEIDDLCYAVEATEVLCSRLEIQDLEVSRMRERLGRLRNIVAKLNSSVNK